MWSSQALSSDSDKPAVKSRNFYQRQSSDASGSVAPYQQAREKKVFPRAEKLYGKSSGNICSYCKRVGHQRKECWRAAHLCLICGGQHNMEKCHKYDPNRHQARIQSNEARKTLN